MEGQQKLTFIDELTALFKQPKTLRSMKYTNWSNTTDKKEYGFDGCYVGTKSQNHDDFYEVFNELGKCVSNGGDMSEELLDKFVFGGDFCELLYTEKEKQMYKPRPSWCCEEVWYAEIKKLRESVDYEVIKMRDCFDNVLVSKKRKSVIVSEYEDLKKLSLTNGLWYSSSRTEEENKKKREEILLNNERKIEECDDMIKVNIKKYDEIQSIIVARCGIKSMTFEERETAEVKYVYYRSWDNTNKKISDFKHLISRSGFIELIKLLSKKERTLKGGEDSVMDLYYKITQDGDDEYITKTAPYCRNGGLQLKTLITRENVFKKKGVELTEITRDDDNMLYVPKMFNIISKRQKLYTEGIKGAKDKNDDAHKPFEPFEKCGVEVVYVRLGYKSNGTKQGNRNRGSLECLKTAYKENKCDCEWSEKKKEYVKIKGLKMPTKKDELTQVLYKL